MFILYINDLVCEIGAAKTNMHADDCILYFTRNNWERVHQTLQASLKLISIWFEKNALKLNARKPKCLVISNRPKLMALNRNSRLMVSNQPLDFANSFNYLGYVLDSEMSLKPLLSHVKMVTSPKIQALYQIRRHLTTERAVTSSAILDLINIYFASSMTIIY